MQVILKDIGKKRCLKKCNNCDSTRIGTSRSDQWVCYDCGRVIRSVWSNELCNIYYQKKKTYKRIFYFNERCSRWLCKEPKIDKDIWRMIHTTAKSPQFKRKKYRRKNISQILRAVKIPNDIQEKFKSRKFKKNLLTHKRFYDKYFEKWKLIASALSDEYPNLPKPSLVSLFKRMFEACQRPFEIYRHAPDCSGIQNCDKYFNCWHNFINYDFVFRKFLQIADYQFKKKGVFEQFKNEFPMVSKDLRDKKLRPLWLKICNYNQWICLNDE